MAADPGHAAGRDGDQFRRHKNAVGPVRLDYVLDVYLSQRRVEQSEAGEKM